MSIFSFKFQKLNLKWEEKNQTKPKGKRVGLSDRKTNNKNQIKMHFSVLKSSYFRSKPALNLKETEKK